MSSDQALLPRALLTRFSRPATAVAMAAVVLRPLGQVRGVDAVDDAAWPVFVVVLAENAGSAERRHRRLVDLLERRDPVERNAALNSHCRWSILDARHGLMNLTVRISAPIECGADIVVPAFPAIGALDVLSRGATVAITTADRARRLTAPIDVGGR